MRKVPHTVSKIEFLCGKGGKAKQEKEKKQKGAGKDEGVEDEELESEKWTEEYSQLLPLHPQF